MSSVQRITWSIGLTGESHEFIVQLVIESPSFHVSKFTLLFGIESCLWTSQDTILPWLQITKVTYTLSTYKLTLIVTHMTIHINTFKCDLGIRFRVFSLQVAWKRNKRLCNYYHYFLVGIRQKIGLAITLPSKSSFFRKDEFSVCRVWWYSRVGVGVGFFLCKPLPVI